MLDYPRFRYHEHGEFADQPPEREFFSLSEVAALLRRYAWTIAGCIALALALAFAYLATAKPIYTAHAQLIIDPQSSEVLRQQTGQTNVSLDTAAVESQIAVLRSERIANMVLNDLGTDSEFARMAEAPPSIFGRLIDGAKDVVRRGLHRVGIGSAAPSPDPAAAEAARRQRAIQAFEASLDVRRVGLSYAIDIYFSSYDPAAAALAANATADAYIRDQVEARAQAARAGGDWLESRITQLREQMDKAGRAVQEFKAAHGLIDTGDRHLLTDQQVAQLNTALITARSKTAEALARLQRIDTILKTDIPDAAVVEVLGNQTINTLRAHYLASASKLLDAQMRYGENEPPVVSLRREMAADLSEIHAELRRIGATYQSDYDIAKAHEATLADELHQLVKKATDTKRAEITANQLETTAQTYQRIYESFLQAYTESVQRQSFPGSDARVITQASTPTWKSRPRTGLILAFALLVGAIAGVAIAIVRKGLDHSVRTPSQIRDEIGLDCLGLLPTIVPVGAARRWLRRYTKIAAPFDEVLTRPYSSFSDGLKTVKTSVSVAGNIAVLGVTSALHGEGKSTIAVNLARLLGAAGSRTLLVDADFRTSSVSAALAPKAAAGLLEAVAGSRPPHSVILHDGASKLDLLPMVGAVQVAAAGDLLASKHMRALLDGLRGSYDVIVVDMPPAMDALGLSPHLDAVLMVAEWGKTPTNVMTETLHALRTVQAQLIGAVITKVSRRASSQYAGKRAVIAASAMV